MAYSKSERSAHALEPMPSRSASLVVPGNDKRVASAQLQALQRIANNSAQTAELRTLQRVVDTAPTQGRVQQLAAVAKDRLNVIGEDHTESEPRVEEEQTYLADAAGGDGYWEETTFKVGEFTRGWGSFIDRRQKGDPTWLHMELQMSGLVHNLKVNLDKSRNGAILAPETHQAEHLWCWDSWMIFIDGIGTYIQERFFDVSEEQINALRAASDEAGVATAKMLALNAAVDSGKNQTAMLSAAHASVDAFATKLYGAIRAMDVIDNERELSMHAAANAGAARKGAWKIGEAHVQSLINADKSPRFDGKQYNVTTRGEFNTEFDAWKSK